MGALFFFCGLEKGVAAGVCFPTFNYENGPRIASGAGGKDRLWGVGGREYP